MCKRILRARLELINEMGPVVGVVDEFGKVLALERYCGVEFEIPQSIDVIDKCGDNIGIKFYLGGEVPTVSKLALPDYLVDAIKGLKFDRVYIYTTGSLFVKRLGVKGFVRMSFSEAVAGVGAEECVLVE